MSDLIHIHSEIWICEPNPDPDNPCPRLSQIDEDAAQWARVVEVRNDLDLLINAKTGERSLRHEAKDPKRWDEVAKHAKRVDWQFTVTLKTLPYLLDLETRLTYVKAGAQSGKTITTAMLMRRLWMLRGGKKKNGEARVIILSGPLLDKAWKLYEYIQHYFPSEIVKACPETKRSSDLTMYLADGTQIVVIPATQKQFGAYRAIGVFITEITKVLDAGILGEALARVRVQKGIVRLEGTTGNTVGWVNTDVVMPATVQAQKAESDPSYKPRFKVHSLKVSDNIFQDPAEAEAAHDDLVNETVRSQLVDGEFADETSKFWGSIWTEAAQKELTLVGESLDPADYGFLNDITSQVSEHILRLGKRDWIGGGDSNEDPFSTVMLKVCGKFEDPSTWNVFVADVVQTRGEKAWGQADRISWVHDHLFENAAIVMDANSIGGSHTTNMIGGPENKTKDDSKHFRAKGFGVRGCVYNPKTKKWRNGSRITRHNIIARLMVERKIFFIHGRCQMLFQAFENQLSTPDGQGPARPKTKRAHMLASPVDGLSYAIGAIFIRGERLAPQIGGKTNARPQYYQ